MRPPSYRPSEFFRSLGLNEQKESFCRVGTWCAVFSGDRATSAADSLWLNHERSRAIGSRIDSTIRSLGNQCPGIMRGMRGAAIGLRMYRGVASRKLWLLQCCDLYSPGYSDGFSISIFQHLSRMSNTWASFSEIAVFTSGQDFIIFAPHAPLS